MAGYGIKAGRVLGVAMMTAALAASGAQAPDWAAGDLEWQCVYDGKTLPGEAALSWRESIGPETEGRVEDEGLLIIDRGTASGQLHCYQRAWGARPADGAVAEARIRLVHNTSRAGAYLGLADGVHETSLTLYPDRISLQIGEDEELTHALDTTDGFHDYRVALRDRDVFVWVDGVPTIDATGRLTIPAHSGRNRIQFGSSSSPAESEAVYAWVRYVTFGERPALPPRYAGAEDVIVYKQAGVYACFPSLEMLDDGALLTSFGTRTRRSHIDTTGGSARYRSTDGGRTWEPFSGSWPLTERLRGSDGSLAQAAAYGWREVPEERRAEFEEQDITIRSVRPGVVAYLQGAVARRSVDDGASWQSEEIALPAHRSLMGFNIGAQCRLANGVRLVSVYGQLKEDRVSRVFVLRSADDGKTWWFLPLAADPEGKVNMNETAIAENERGEVVAMIRSEPPEGGFLYQSVSADGGITWSPARRTELWGYPAHVLRLSDGRMLCSYGYRREPMGIRAVLSNDGGHTWDAENVIVLRNDAAPFGSDLGYPISVETSPGRVFTIYYFTMDDDITHVAGTHWTAPEAAG